MSYTVGSQMFGAMPEQVMRMRFSLDDFEENVIVTLRKLDRKEHGALYPVHIEWKPVGGSYVGSPLDEEQLPLMPIGDALRLMDMLWDLGLRPTGFRVPQPPPPGIAEAKEANLVDLRRVLDRSLTIVERLSPPLVHMSIENNESSHLV